MSEEKTLSANAQKVLDLVKKLTVLELADLVSEMEEVFGVSAVAPVAVTAVGPTATAEEDEKTEFDVMLVSVGDKKINVIKVVKDVLGLGLKEAKDEVESAPKALKEGVKKEEAEELKAKLEAAGATVELK